MNALLPFQTSLPAIADISALPATPITLAQASSETISQAAQSPSMPTSSLIICVVLGLLLITFGRKLAKVGSLIVGLLLGAILGMTLIEIIGFDRSYLTIATIACALLGLGLTHTMFKFWTVIGTGLILAYAAPALFLAAINAQWIQLGDDQSDSSTVVTDTSQETDDSSNQITSSFLDPATQQAQDATNQLQQSLGPLQDNELIQDVFGQVLNPSTGDDTSDQTSHPSADPTGSDSTQQTTEQILDYATDTSDQAMNWLKKTGAALHSLYQSEYQHINAWWEQHRTQASPRHLLTAAVVGLALGIGMGILMPNIATAFQAAAIGSVLLTLPGRMLIEQYFDAPARFLPHTPRMVLLSLSLITITGVIIQCRPKSSKADD